MTQAPETLSDYLRQIANLILAPAMWILSSIGFVHEAARTPSEFSDMSDNLLVPLGPAFSIWFPVFVGCLAYGIYQALPQNRTHEIFRQTGWWSAVGFACICGWSLITAYAPSNLVQWGSALIFIPAVAFLIFAMIRMSSAFPELSLLEKWTCWLPLSLIAGWCSLAIFLNWTPIAYDLFAGGSADLVSSLFILAAALGLIVWACWKADGNKAYIFPALWGLSWLAIRHFGEGETPALAYFAILGGGLLIGSALIISKRSSSA